MDLLVLVAPSSRFVERLAKRHGWKPCPPVLADERIRRNSGPQNSLRNALGVRRGMDPPVAAGASSSRFIKRRCKRHGWKPCPSRSSYFSQIWREVWDSEKWGSG
jgi:hypothetical protein